MMKYAIILLLVLLVGCTRGIEISIPFSYQTLDQPKGYLVGLLGADTQGPKNGKNLITTVSFRKIDKENNAFFYITNDNKHADFDDSQTTGQLFTIKLPIGQYEISRIYIKGSDGRRTVISQNQRDLHIRFTIKENQANYIGQFIAVSRVANSELWNVSYPSGHGYLKHRYKKQQDTSLFYSLNPTLTEIPFHTEVLDIKSNNIINSSDQ